MVLCRIKKFKKVLFLISGIITKEDEIECVCKEVRQTGNTLLLQRRTDAKKMS